MKFTPLSKPTKIFMDFKLAIAQSTFVWSSCDDNGVNERFARVSIMLIQKRVWVVVVLIKA